MNAQRSGNLFVTLMTAVALWGLALGAHTYWYATGLSVFLALHLLRNFRLTGRPTIFTGLLLIMPFAVWFRYLSHNTFSGFTPVDLLFLGGFYSLALGTHHLLCSETGGSRAYAFAAAIIAMTLAGVAQKHHLFLPLVIVFMPLVLLELRRSLGLLTVRPTRGLMISYAAALLLLLAVTSASQFLVVVEVPAFNQWLARKMLDSMSPRSAGFSRISRLGSVAAGWQQGAENQIVVRQWSAHPADHLRAAVYDQYNAGSWRAVPEMREVRPQGEENGRQIFHLPPNGAKAALGAAGGTIYPDPEFGADFFLPTGTQAISAFCDQVAVSTVLTVSSPQRQAAGGYSYFNVIHDTTPPTDLDLQVPDKMRGPLEHIARTAMARVEPSIKAGDQKTFKTPAERVQAAEGLALYFKKDFTYHIGLDLKTDKDPVLEFLQDIKSGHCEYFAASGALMLRSLGIPARYVTGFMCAESGPDGTYTFARRKDAHAWVEMYLPGQGWVTFDPTPPEARPQPVVTTMADRLMERIDALWQRIWSVAAYGGVVAILVILWTTFMSVLGMIPIAVWALVVIAGLLWIFRARVLSLIRGEREAPQTRRVRQLRAKLHLAEKILGRHGLTRPPGMPVGEFLHGVKDATLPQKLKLQATELLSEYQALRFRRIEEPEGRA